MRTAKPKSTPEDKIRARAHEIWEHNGRPDGQDLDHWRQAEAELAPRAKKPGKAAAPKKAKPAAKAAAAAPKSVKAKPAKSKAKPKSAAAPKRRKAAAD